jgi:hypothetical protein
MRETFVWTGARPQVLEPNELVGRDYQDADGRHGKIVGNTALSVTVEFTESFLDHVIGRILAVNWGVVLPLAIGGVLGIAIGLATGGPRP